MSEEFSQPNLPDSQTKNLTDSQPENLTDSKTKNLTKPRWAEDSDSDENEEIEGDTVETVETVDTVKTVETKNSMDSVGSSVASIEEILVASSMDAKADFGTENPDSFTESKQNPSKPYKKNKKKNKQVEAMPSRFLNLLNVVKKNFSNDLIIEAIILLLQNPNIEQAQSLEKYLLVKQFKKEYGDTLKALLDHVNNRRTAKMQPDIDELKNAILELESFQEIMAQKPTSDQYFKSHEVAIAAILEIRANENIVSVKSMNATRSATKQLEDWYHGLTPDAKAQIYEYLTHGDPSLLPPDIIRDESKPSSQGTSYATIAAATNAMSTTATSTNVKAPVTTSVQKRAVQSHHAYEPPVIGANDVVVCQICEEENVEYEVTGEQEPWRIGDRFTCVACAFEHVQCLTRNQGFVYGFKGEKLFFKKFGAKANSYSESDLNYGIICNVLKRDAKGLPIMLTPPGMEDREQCMTCFNPAFVNNKSKEYAFSCGKHYLCRPCAILKMVGYKKCKGKIIVTNYGYEFLGSVEELIECYNTK